MVGTGSASSHLSPMSQRLEYGLTIPPEEALSRLDSVIDEERISIFSSSGFAGGEKFHGKIRGHRFHIRKRHSFGMPFGRYLHARIEPEGSGSRITGTFRMDAVARAFLFVYLLFLGFPTLGLIRAIVMRGSVGRSDLESLAGVAFLVLGEVGILLFSWRVSDRDRRATIALLDEAFEGCVRYSRSGGVWALPPRLPSPSAVLAQITEGLNLRRILLTLAVWLGLVVLLGAVLGSINLIGYYRLTEDGARIYGTVRALEPENHATVVYSYRARGRVYREEGDAGYGNPEFERLRVGQRVLVTYLRTGPRMSCLGRADERLRNEFVSIGISVLVFPALIAWWMSTHLIR